MSRAVESRGLTVELAGVATALFTSRADGNLSTQRGVDPGHGRARRDELCERLGLDWLCASRQVHGTDVQLVRSVAGRGGEAVAIDADGHATALAGVGAMVLTADCLPVALAASGATPAVAIVHAGWRGLAAGVLEGGVRALRELGADGELEAAIGPGAGACCYEVGADVHAALAVAPGGSDGDWPAGGRPRAGDADGAGGADGIDNTGGTDDACGATGGDAGARRGGRAPGNVPRTIDLRAIARERLLAVGVAHVQDVDVCTICDERFFSHRRERERAGRQAGIAWLG